MLSGRLRAHLSAALAVLGGLSSCSSPPPPPSEPLQRDASASYVRRDAARVFYSGHSLTDGVPEAVAAIAQSLGKSFQFEQQSIPGSLLRERTKGRDVKAAGFPGYRTGRNRQGEGLDVQAELSRERPPEQRYQALVVTERHDLPWSARNESTTFYLQHMAAELLRGNPEADAYFYHGWLGLDLAEPAPWLSYERGVLRLWECVASSANRALQKRGLAARIRVLPGATALAQLVEELVHERVPGLRGASVKERLQLVFRDDVHLSELGTYYMGLVHFAVLFGQSPVGAAAPHGVSVETARFLQRLAHAEVLDYAQLSAAAAQRSAQACREYAAYGACPAFYQYRHEGSLLSTLKRRAQIERCRASYLHDAPDHPFRD